MKKQSNQTWTLWQRIESWLVYAGIWLVFVPMLLLIVGTLLWILISAAFGRHHGVY